MEGLASEDLLLKALDLAAGDPAVLPSALMERLNDRDAQILARAGAERQAPVLDLSACVEALRNLRLRRELQEIEARSAGWPPAIPARPG